jgi:paraquat-inducible protein A
LTRGAPRGITTRQGMPASRAASASAAPWLPDEWVTTPAAASPPASDSTALAAPRNLKAPVRWKGSALKNRRAPARRSADDEVRTGVRRAQGAMRRAAARMAARSGSAGGAALTARFYHGRWSRRSPLCGARGRCLLPPRPAAGISLARPHGGPRVARTQGRRARGSMWITCADCGSVQVVPDLPLRTIAECHRCDRLLDRHAATSLGLSMASAAAMLLLLPFAAFHPILESTIRNLVFDESRLITSVPVIYREVWFPFAFGFLFFALLFPALRALFLVVVLASLHWGWSFPLLGRLFRWNQELRIWSMTDVVVVAGVATYFRAAAPADVEIQIGAWCYVAAAALAFLADRALDHRRVWNAILPDLASASAAPAAAPGVSCGVCELTATGRRSGEPCPRCGSRLERDVTRRYVPSLVCLAAAVPLAVPAYSYAVMVNDQLTGLWELTILGTVQLLADQGLWILGVVLLVAGVVIPFVELAGFTWLLARVRFPNRSGLIARTRTYRVLRDLVRWPMVIPFIAATSAPIVDFPGLDDIITGPGATPFFLFIVLLMLTVRLFEPRLMWKAAGELA